MASESKFQLTMMTLLGFALAQFSSSHASAVKGQFDEKDRSHWAFQKVVRPEVPAVETGTSRNPIDAFILAELETKRIQPAPPAEKVVLLRRVSLDLIGLPPTPREVDDFLADNSLE